MTKQTELNEGGFVNPRVFPLMDHFADTLLTCMAREDCVFLLVKRTKGQPPISMWMSTVQSGFPGRHERHTGSLQQGGLLPLPVLKQDTDVERKKNQKKKSEKQKRVGIFEYIT